MFLKIFLVARDKPLKFIVLAFLVLHVFSWLYFGAFSFLYRMLFQPNEAAEGIDLTVLLVSILPITPLLLIFWILVMESFVFIVCRMIRVPKFGERKYTNLLIKWASKRTK